MRIVMFVAVMLMIPATSEASSSCMSKTQARQHFGSVHIYWHGADHCWDATPIRLHHQPVRKVEHKVDQPRSQDADRLDLKPQDSRSQDSRQDSKRQDSGRQEARQQDVKRAKSPWQASMSQMTADDEPVQATLQAPAQVPVQASVQAPVQRPVQRSWADRWVDIKPAPLPLSERWVDIAPVTSPPNKSVPDPELRMMVLGLVFIVIALMLAMIEVLFRAASGAGERDEAVA